MEHNKVVEHLPNTKDIGLRYLCLHPSEAVCCIIGDGAGAEQGESHQQGRYLVAVSDESVAEGHEATLNILAARTGKLDKVCNSSLDVEANIAVAAIAAGEWVIMLYGEFSNAKFDPQLFRTRLRAWDKTTTAEPSPGYKFRGTLVMRDSG